MNRQILCDSLRRSNADGCLSEPHNVLGEQEEAHEPYSFGDVFSLR